MKCDITTYWLGTTSERFTIAEILNESSDLLVYNPNTGTNTAGVKFNFSWIMDNFNTTSRHVFKGPILHKVLIHPEDVHGLLIVPAQLGVYNLREIVLGSLMQLVESVHYAKMQIENEGDIYDVIYLRDLSGIEYTSDRQIVFEVKLLT